MTRRGPSAPERFASDRPKRESPPGARSLCVRRELAHFGESAEQNLPVPLDLGCYSFHDTKSYICGEGGALCVNDPELVARAEIIRDKGINRQKFFRGEVDKYTRVEVGSSYVPSEICSAFLYGQLEMLDAIARRRHEIYQNYRRLLKPLEAEGWLRLPYTPEDCTSNYHMFYILLPNAKKRDEVLAYLKSQSIHAVFHYVPLHTSPMGRKLGYKEGDLPVTEDLASRLMRLPMFDELSGSDIAILATLIRNTCFLGLPAETRVASSTS